ncbi:MAG TPA: FAD-dependent oxidoreductase, partial [Labilithrix sp.]|nr:FAD-dependent oxidoreductase [Labilithrix sp.]
RPRSLRDGMRALESVYASGGNMRDVVRYLTAHVKYLTACDDRREREIEATPWSRFIGADRPGAYADEFREVLLACTRTLVAMDAERGSSRTVGQASCLLLLDALGDSDLDRTMMGPTTECWIDPWQAHLESQGVAFRFGERLERLELENGRIARAWIGSPDGERRALEADAYVLAVPFEVAVRLLGPALREADEALARLQAMDVDDSTSWMCGAQYFLSEDVPLVEGHLFMPDSPWSLTVISQAQFWNRGRRGMSTYGDGRLRGILSVDVSSCFTRDEDGVRLVDETTREGILRRVLRQVTSAVDRPAARQLERAVYASKLDDELTVGEGGVTNAGRLLVHPPGSRALRPHAVLEGIPNLYLAADYVKTSMDLASMEGANEAGRLAARGILERAGLDASCVETYAYDELGRLERLRAVDGWLHAHGLPHLFDVQEHAVRVLRQGRDRLVQLAG